MPPFCPGGPAAGVMPHGPSGIPHGGPLGKEPDLKALFAKMDKNKDGKLTVEEFTEGMKKLHEEMMAHCMQRARCLGRVCRCRQGPCPVCRCPRHRFRCRE